MIEEKILPPTRQNPRPLSGARWTPGFQPSMESWPTHLWAPVCPSSVHHPLPDWVTEHQGISVVLLKCPWGKTAILAPKTAASAREPRSAPEPSSTALWGASPGSRGRSPLLKFLRKLTLGRGGRARSQSPTWTSIPPVSFSNFSLISISFSNFEFPFRSHLQLDMGYLQE